MAQTHVLKSWPENFAKILDRTCLGEIREFDRDFKVGDFIRLREFDPGPVRPELAYTGREALLRIVGIQRSPADNPSGLISFCRATENLPPFKLVSTDKTEAAALEEKATGSPSTIER